MWNSMRDEVRELVWLASMVGGLSALGVVVAVALTLVVLLDDLVAVQLMAIHTQAINTLSRPDFPDLQAGLIDYASRVDQLRSPDEVLNELHAITTRTLPLSVLGAARFPLKSGDWDVYRAGKIRLPARETCLRAGGRTTRLSPGANFVPCISWRSPAWGLTPGAKLSACCSRLGLTNWLTNWASSMGCAMGSRARLAVGGWWASGRARTCPTS